MEWTTTATGGDTTPSGPYPVSAGGFSSKPPVSGDPFVGGRRGRFLPGVQNLPPGIAGAFPGRAGRPVYPGRPGGVSEGAEPGP